MIVVNCTDSIELVIMPLSFIGYCSIRIVQCAISFHFVIFPFSSVLASFLVNELSLSVPHSIFLESLIASANIILLNNKAIFIIFLLYFRVRYGLIRFSLSNGRLACV